MKSRILFIILIIVSLLAFTSCSCEHVWVEADCLNPRTCSECQATEGEPSGHTPGEWNEVTDLTLCTVSKERYCSVCNVLTDSETASLGSLIQDDIFLFTPEEFMERLSLIAEQHSDEFTYEFVPSSTGLQVSAYSNGKQSIIQFFHGDATALTSDELNTAAIWCVSLTSIGESDADFRLYFFMACDPMLDKDAAFDTDMDLSTAFLNAAATEEFFGYHQQNQLLYETTYIAEDTWGQDYSMSMVNIYASDFRQS